MRKELFDVCLGFHRELIRAELSPATIANAEKILVDGDSQLVGVNAQRRSRAKAFADTLENRLDTLTKFYQAEWTIKTALYKASHERAPAAGVFIAVEMVLVNGLKIGTAATACGVNFQSVKVLKPRIERYETFAAKINALTL